MGKGNSKKTGFHVDRKGYGIIRFNEKDIRKGLNYADTAEERAAIAALPAVLKRGVEIGSHANHKNRKKQTITFAAPVEINEIRGNMAVVVNKNGNHYYAHRIALPNGNVFAFADGENVNATRETSQGVTVSGSLAKTTSVAFDNSVPNSAKKVKGKFSLETADDQDIRYDLTDEEARKAPDPGHPNTLVTKGLFKSDQEVQLYA